MAGDTASHAGAAPAGTLAALVAETTGASPVNCYQCGRCAAGCPQNVAGEMDLSPTRVMRLLQLEAAFAGQSGSGSEHAAKALAADTPWLCAGCQACTTRCPQSVDIAGTMDVLRQESLRRNVASRSKRAKDIQALHKTFLGGALKHGRVHELFMVMAYKLRTGHFFADALLGPAMMAKGKLHLLPGKSPATDRVRKAAEQLKTNHSAPEAHQA